MWLIQAFIEDITNLQTVCTYFLIGIIIAAILEHIMHSTDVEVTNSDRFWIVLGWPLASAVFIYYFIKGLLGDD